MYSPDLTERVKGHDERNLQYFPDVGCDERGHPKVGVNEFVARLFPSYELDHTLGEGRHVVIQVLLRYGANGAGFYMNNAYIRDPVDYLGKGRVIPACEDIYAIAAMTEVSC